MAATCQLCNNLEFKTARQYRISLEFTLHELAKAAKAGCGLCRLWAEGILKYDAYWHPAYIRRIEISGRSVDDNHGSATITARIMFSDDRQPLSLEFFHDLLVECKPNSRKSASFCLD
jgi:hypothetical protein